MRNRFQPFSRNGVATPRAYAIGSRFDARERRLNHADLGQPDLAKLFEHFIAYAVAGGFFKIGRAGFIQIMLNLNKPVVEFGQSGAKTFAGTIKVKLEVNHDGPSC